MAKVPRGEYTKDLPGALPRALSSESPLPAIARSQAQLTGELVNTVDAIGKVVAQEKQRADDIAVLEADQKASALETNLLYSPEGGALTRKGKNAFGAHPEVMAAYTKGVGEISENLSESQRLRFARMAASRQRDLDTAVQRHVAGEISSYDKDVTKAYVENEQQAGIQNYKDPERVKISVERQRAALADFASRNGLPEEVLKQQVEESVSKTHSGVVSRLLANDKDRAAKEYFEKNKEDITGSDAMALEKSMKEGTLRGESQRKADSIVSSHMVRSDALAEARKIQDPELRDETERRVVQHFDKQKADLKEAQEALYLDAANAVKNNPGANPRDVIPPTAWTNLSTSQQKALTTRNTAPTQGSPRTWLEFSSLSPVQLAGLSQAEFESDYWSHMDEEHRVRAQALWENARGTKGNDPKLTHTLSIQQRIDASLRTAGLVDPNKPKGKWSDEEARTYYEFNTQVARGVEAYETNDLGGKRKATGEEVQKIINDMTKLTVKRGIFGGRTVSIYGLKPGEKLKVSFSDIPKTELEKITDALSRAGQQITPERVTEVYQRKLTKALARE